MKTFNSVAQMKSVWILEGQPKLIKHDCSQEGPIMIEAGKPCNWCDKLDEN